MVFVCLSYTCGTIIMEKFSKSVLNSFFFASLCPCIAIIRRIVPENSNNRTNCVLSLHAHTYYMPSDTNQRWSLVPLVEHFLLVCLDLHQELLYAFFLWHIYCDHSFGHASRIAQIAHFLSIIFEFVWFTFRIKILDNKLHGKCEIKKVDDCVVGVLFGVYAYAYCLLGWK